MSNKQQYQQKPKHKQLSKIIKNRPNLITLLRLLLLFIAMLIFSNLPSIACFLIMISVLLDYVDGKIARKYNQCLFFGHCFDWIVDICSSILMFLLWVIIEPQIPLIMFFFILIEMVSMVIDITSQSINFSPTIKADQWLTCILKITMQPGKVGYCCQGLGYINMVNYYLCGVARILYLLTQSNLWWWIFVLNLLPALSYIMMGLAYTKNILDHWTEQTNQTGNIQVIFKK